MSRWLKWGVPAVAVVIIAAIVVPTVLTLEADYYRRFPALGDRMDHWEISTHSRISCIACHVNPGLEGMVEYAVTSVPAFYTQLIEGPTAENLLGAPPKRACQKCHTSYRKVAPSGDLLIPHKAHVEVLDMECGACHKDLVHSANRRGFNRPEMEVCLELCHDGDAASDECTDCHTRKAIPDSHDAPEWLQVHGDKAATEDCGVCHDWTPGYCAACHEQRPASHVGNWKSGHAPVALERGDGCMVCHDKEFCEQCH